jgi:hypothetical protein
MSNIVVISPPTEKPFEVEIIHNVNFIKELMGFKNICSNIILLNNIPIIVYFDSYQQRKFGINPIATKLFNRKINGNCVFGIIDGNFSLNFLKKLLHGN